MIIDRGGIFMLYLFGRMPYSAKLFFIISVFRSTPYRTASSFSIVPGSNLYSVKSFSDPINSRSILFGKPFFISVISGLISCSEKAFSDRIIF